MKKNIIIFTLILALAVSFAGCSRVYPTVLTVDGEEVSMKEYNFFYYIMLKQAEQSVPTENANEYWETEMDGKTNYQMLKDSAYNELVNLCVVAKKAEQMGLTYDETVMQMATSFRNNFISIAASAQDFYDMTQTDVETVNKITKMYAIREALCQKLFADGIVDVSETAMAQAFNNEYMKANHILISTVDDSGNPLPQEQIAAKKTQADQIYARVTAGENFDALVAEFSEDPGKATNPGGYVFTEGEMVTEFEEAVKALEFGGVSGIVESQFGYHIIKRLPLDYATDGTAIQNIEQILMSSLVTNYLNSNMEAWKTEFGVIENKTEIDKLKR